MLKSQMENLQNKAAYSTEVVYENDTAVLSFKYKYLLSDFPMYCRIIISIATRETRW